MSIRARLNQHPTLAAAVAGAVLIACVLWMIYSATRPESHASGKGMPTRDYFTEDDGASYFEDDFANVPPFQHGQNEAVRAVVFQCAGGAPFVGYLEKYKPDDKVEFEKALKDFKPGGFGPPPFVFMYHKALVKKAGAGHEWVSRENPAQSDPIVQVKCQDGSDAVRIGPKR